MLLLAPGKNSGEKSFKIKTEHGFIILKGLVNFMQSLMSWQTFFQPQKL